MESKISIKLKPGEIIKISLFGVYIMERIGKELMLNRLISELSKQAFMFSKKRIYKYKFYNEFHENDGKKLRYSLHIDKNIITGEIELMGSWKITDEKIFISNIPKTIINSIEIGENVTKYFDINILKDKKITGIENTKARNYKDRILYNSSDPIKLFDE